MGILSELRNTLVPLIRQPLGLRVIDGPVNTVHQNQISLQNIWYGSPYGANLPVDRNVIRDYTLRQPEVYTRMEIISNDVLSDFEILCKDPVYKKEVEQWLIRQNFRTKLKSAYFDKLLRGNGYMETVFVPADKVQRSLDSLGKRMNLSKNFSGKVMKQLRKDNAKFFEPSGIYWVKGSTVYKKVNEHGDLIEYNQVVDGRGNVAQWLPGELVEFANFNFDSDVYGFTPLLVALDDIATLDVTKQYVRNFFQNNGMPDYLVSIKNAAPNSAAQVKLENEFKQRQISRKRGVLVASGDVNAIELTRNRDMDFPKIFERIDAMLDMLWGIPPEKLGGTDSKTRGGDAAMSSYYVKIAKEQRETEDSLNANFFSLFGEKPGDVQIRFTESYARNQVRDATWIDLMYKAGRVSPAEYRSKMGYSAEDPDDISKNPFFKSPVGSQKQDFPSSKPAAKLTDNNVGGAK